MDETFEITVLVISSLFIKAWVQCETPGGAVRHAEVHFNHQ